MALFPSKKQARTAIIIKDHVIRFVHAKRPELTAIHSFGERYLPQGVVRDGKILEPDTLEAILQQCVHEWGIKKHHVQFIVPNDYTVLRKEQVPLTVKKDELKGYLYTVIGASIHLPFDEPALDVHDLGERDGQRDILLIAAPENMVQQFSDLLETAKLKPNAADISALSYYRLFHELDRDNKSDHFLFVQLDILKMNITIFHDQKPIFMRNIKLSIDEDQWKLINEASEGSVWQGTEAEINGQVQDIITELERIMNFYRSTVHQGNLGITKMLLTGDYPYLEKVATSCKQTFDISVEMLHDKDVETINGEQVPIRFHEVVGLALKKEVYDVS
ncbi:hypothetical protein BKP35_14350 [Anaerobacillus arseniciselenatis]|uniref:Pilus assembly protein PilM n=1 Tax=Anaerobacillus arseniciselenatis TaxID=85682 RepID=A0A1S2LFI9_9BACI|nr:pilus assembly protein PilM [Anaerobacillus arseniciselenatis]OIJ10275.1 hypothetical protein BKP35_14350 [Anaerobacillus arseniciselenatis]